MQFRAEAFNALNHTNFGVQTTAIFNGSGAPLASAGVLQQPTLTTSRQIQLGVKIHYSEDVPHMRRRSSSAFLSSRESSRARRVWLIRSSEEERRSKPYPEDIPAARMVVDPYPALNGIAVDPQNDVVIASDPNRKSLLLYDRSRNTIENSQTRPVRQIIGPATYIGMVASVVVDSQRQEIFTANNDIEDTVVVMPYAAKGNVAPRRVLSVPHQAWGLALGKFADELAVTAEIFNAVVFYRREAKGVEAPVRVIRGPKTRLADPHGIYWDDANAEIGVANHGNFRGVIHNTGAGCAPGPPAS